MDNKFRDLTNEGRTFIGELAELLTGFGMIIGAIVMLAIAIAEKAGWRFYFFAAVVSLLCFLVGGSQIKEAIGRLRKYE
ncbi:MAG: hypothetical protein V1661_02225 [bacterium]